MYEHMYIDAVNNVLQYSKEYEDCMHWLDHSRNVFALEPLIVQY